MAVVSLHCPFVKPSEDYAVGIEAAAEAYTRETWRRRPRGPYALGRWSVGGIFALHAVQELARQGERVAELELIDCPVLRGLDYLLRCCYDYCKSVGLLGASHGVQRAPGSLATLRPATRACTQVVWAYDAVDRHLESTFERRPDVPIGLKFLTAARTDCGPCCWETLLPETDIVINRVEDCSHSVPTQWFCANAE